MDTVGYGALLALEYERRLDVINRGASGFSTRRFNEFLIPMLQLEWSQGPKPANVTFCIGANDAALPDSPDNWALVPLEEFERNLRDILQFSLILHQKPK